MLAPEFTAICKMLFGREGDGYGWQSRMHERTGTSTRTIQSWADGTNPIPPLVAWSLRKLSGREG